MARPGTAVERRADDRLPRALSDRLLGAVERRAGDRVSGALSDRLLDAVERRLARAVERRLGRPSDRRPGRFEQRVVALLQRRMSAPASPGSGALGRAAQAVAHRRPGGGLPAEQATTLRALVVSLLSRGIVRALVRLVRILSRGLVSRPARRLAGILARRALRVRPTNQAGLLALLLAAVLLAYRALARRLAGMPQAQRTAILLGLRGLRVGLPQLGRLALRLLRTLAATLRRELARRRGR